MSISGTSKSTILAQKLNELKNQEKKLHLIIAPPRSVSTAFTRALCHASDSDGVHELLYHLENNNDLNLIKPFTKNVIFKEMAQASCDAKELKDIYTEKLKIMIEQAQEPIVIITANPQTILLSIIQATVRVVCEEIDGTVEHPTEYLDQFKEKFNAEIPISTQYTNNNTLAINDLIHDIPYIMNKKILIFNSDDIKINPIHAVQNVMKKWFPEILHLPDDYNLQLSPIVNNFTEESLRQTSNYNLSAKYLLSYNDNWVSDADRKAEYFRPHLKISEDKNHRIEKMKEYLLTEFTSTFKDIQNSDIDKLTSTQEEINTLMRETLSKIKNLSQHS